MRSSLILVASLVAFSGCIIHADDNDDGKHTPPIIESRGDITFEWSLGGLNCGQASNIEKVRVRLTGPRGIEALEDAGYYPCNTAGVDGIKLRDFAPGNYNFTLDALDRPGNVLYSASGSVYVDGNVQARVVLTAVGGPGKMEVFWTFNGGNSCANSGLGEDRVPVTHVVVTLNGDFANSVTWPCSSGGVEGIATDLEPGTYNIQVDGYVGTGEDSELWYSATSDLSIDAGVIRTFEIDLAPVAASATFMPVLRNYAGQRVTCAQAGVSTISAWLIDIDGNPTAPYFGECELFATAGFLWPWLLASDAYDSSVNAWKGTWTVRMEGWDVPATNHNVVLTGSAQVSVVAGWDDQSFNVDLIPR